jgi:tetratricopeptide (TPR) repeat protein
MARIVNLIFSLLGLGVAGWLFWYAFERSRDRVVLLIKWLVSAPIGYLIYTEVIPGFRQGGESALFALIGMLLCGLVLAVLWAGSITDFCAKPFSSLYDGGDEPPEPKPLYSMAMAKRKRNKPLEAVMAIREQLAKFPNDYEGVVMLAQIQAEDLKDLPSAEMTVNHFCEWDQAPSPQVAALLTQLADWHLKFFQDPHSARAALERIVEKYPDTDLALVAKQRIAHLGGTTKTLMATHERGAIFVPEGEKNVGLLESSAHLVPAETSPGETAGAYVKHLQEHPDDTEAREKLAIIYARHYQRLDLAAAELEQMIEEPNHPPKRTAHWLNLLADLQIHGGADYEVARATLEKIVERFPDYAVAEVARTRLAHLKLEFKALGTTPHKTLGVYEQNIGLKSKRGY